MSILYSKLFVVFVTIAVLLACRRQEASLREIQAGQIRIDSTLAGGGAMDSLIAPFRNRLNEVLDAPLCYAPEPIVKTDGTLNSSLGNLMADIILERGSKVFLMQENKRADLALHNNGGIRTSISRGPVTERTAYEVMPFENTIVIAGLKGSTLRKMADFLSRNGEFHPVSGVQIALSPDGSPQSIRIQGEPLDEDRVYYVATSDYLVGGGNGMAFFQESVSLHKTGYKIRNAMVDYFRDQDTLRSRVDERVTIKHGH